MTTKRTIQKSLTPAAGKRLIAKAVAERPDIESVLERGRLVIIAGTTNGYVAQEILKRIGQADNFDFSRFFRGVVLPPHLPTKKNGRVEDESKFPGDVIVIDGRRISDSTIFDIEDDLRSGDIILKGANAVNLETREAAVLIGHPKAGTIGVALQALVGRRVQLIMPVGVEKRIHGDLQQIARLINSPTTAGPRLLPVGGEIVTELDAIEQLTGAKAYLVAGGGVGGAEGSAWLAVTGMDDQLESAASLLKSVEREPGFVPS